MTAAPRVFISYARADQDFVRQLYDALKSAGIDVFLDNELSVGSNLFTVLGDAIRRSDAVVTVMSPAYFESKWSQTELALALEAGKRLLPVLVSGSPQGALSYLHYFDASTMPQGQLSSQIASLLRGSNG